MKKTVLSLILFFFTAGFIYFSSENNSKAPTTTTLTVSDNQFMVGAMDCAWDFQYSHIPDLNLNTWHKYTDSPPIGDSVLGWLENNSYVHIQDDRYTNSDTLYSTKIAQRITLNSGTYGYQSLMDRPKTNYLADGQRSFYQCEDSSSLTQEFRDYSFYTYKTHNTGTSQLDSVFEVVHCRTLPVDNYQDAPGYVVKDLNTNREQTSAGSGYNYKQRDDIGNWYVMPKIRIPTGIPDTTHVCKIDILDWNGQPVQAFPNGVEITAGKFKNNFTTYNGNYLDKFYWNAQSQDPSPIEIPAGQLTYGTSPGDWKDWTNSNFRTDFRVWWYGQCDMWIDYVCVENQPAYQLFDDPNYINIWNTQIRHETDLALTGSGGRGYIPNNFYLEEFEFNNLPCIGKVNSIIQDEASQHGVDISLMMNLNYALFKVHVPDPNGTYDMTSGQLKRFLVDSAKAKTIVNVSYVMEGWPDSPPYASQRFAFN